MHRAGRTTITPPARWRSAAWTALAGLACTAALTAWLHAGDAERLAAALRAEAHAHAEHLDAALRHASDQVGQLAATIAADDDAHRVPLAAFAAEHLVERSGLQLVWAPRVPRTRRAAHEAEGAATHLGYRIIERDVPAGFVAAGPRADHFPLYDEAPVLGERPPWGLDLASEQRRRQAIEAARDSGTPMTTAPLRLGLGSIPITAILLVHPVYEGGGRPRTVERRQALLRGVAIGVLRMQGFLESTMAGFRHPLALRVLDDSDESGANALVGSLGWRDREPIAEVRLQPYGRSWRLQFAPTDEFLAAHRSNTQWLAALLALACTAALTGYVANQSRKQEAIEARVAERTAALALSEARHRTVMENLAEALVVADASGVIESVNPAAEALFGWRADELVGHNVAVLMPEADRGAHDRAVRDCPPGARSRVMGRGRELLAVRRDGSRVPIYAAVSRTGEGPDARFIAAMRDRTAEQRAAEAVRERNLFLERIVAHMPHGVAVVDAGLKVMAYNAEFVRVCELPAERFPFGTALEAILRFHAARGDLGPPADAEAAVRRRLAQAARGEGGRSERHHADGRVIEVDSQPVTGGGFITSFTDVTARREFEASLVRAREAAEATARAKTDFLAMMSHEIRTPMNAVLGFAEALLHSDLDAEQREFAETLRGSGQSLLALLNDILDYSKLEADRVVLERVAFDPREVLAHIAALWTGPASEKGLLLGVHAERDVPTAVYGDPGRVTQILQNLVANAVKFTPSGTIGVTLRAVAEADGRALVRMEVADTGIGMTEAVAGTLFRPFVQADASTTRRFGGTGLGLSICRNLAERMGGAIGVVSSPGAGSTFWCELPFDRAAREAIVRADAGRDEVPRLRGRVLLAEDNDVNRKVARAALRRVGVEVVEVENGAEAVARCGTDIDLVLMDVHMPVCDGIEAARRIRAAETPGRRVPILALTANTADDARRQCEAAGMDGYVTKPFAFAELAAAMAPWLPAALAVTDEPPAAPTAPTLAMEAPPAPPVDRTRLDAVRAAMGEDFHELVEVFLASADELVRALQAALAAGDAVAFHRHAHTLKSSAGQVGAHPLAALARDLEADAKAGLPADGAARVPTIAAEYARVREWLAQHFPAREAA